MLGVTVLSVDMLPENILHVQTSLAESSLGRDVTMVNNGLHLDPVENLFCLKFSSLSFPREISLNQI